MEQATELVFVCLLFSVYIVSQEEKWLFWGHSILAILSKKAYMYMCPIPMVSEKELFHCTVVWAWHPILAFPLAVVHQCLKRVNWCEASVDHYDCDVKMHSDQKHAMYLTRVAKCIDWQQNFQKCIILSKLYQLAIWTINTGTRNSMKYFFLINNFGIVKWIK
jgi:hypothetical protein